MNLPLLIVIHIISNLDRLGRFVVLVGFAVLSYSILLDAGAVYAAPIFAVGCLLWIGGRRT